MRCSLYLTVPNSCPNIPANTTWFCFQTKCLLAYVCKKRVYNSFRALNGFKLNLKISLQARLLLALRAIFPSVDWKKIAII